MFTFGIFVRTSNNLNFKDIHRLQNDRGGTISFRPSLQRVAKAAKHPFERRGTKTKKKVACFS